MKLQFWLEEIRDNDYIRDNFKRLQDAIGSEPILRAGFKFFQIDAGAVTQFSYPHRLKFTPKDVILMSVSDNKDVTFHYDSFTSENIVFTTTGACTFRCFIGTYVEGIG